MPATRADVARLAGVSPSTVTYVLTGKRATSESTRNRVLHAIEELGYLPNRHASVLAAHSVRSASASPHADERGARMSAVSKSNSPHVFLRSLTRRKSLRSASSISAAASSPCAGGSAAKSPASHRRVPARP